MRVPTHNINGNFFLSLERKDAVSLSPNQKVKMEKLDTGTSVTEDLRKEALEAALRKVWKVLPLLHRSNTSVFRMCVSRDPANPPENSKVTFRQPFP